MALDEARHQRGAGQLDDLGAGGFDAGVGPGGFDAIAGHPHGPTFMHNLTVEDARRLQQRGGGRLRLGRERSQGEQETNGKGTVYRHGVIISRFTAGGAALGTGGLVKTREPLSLLDRHLSERKVRAGQSSAGVVLQQKSRRLFPVVSGGVALFQTALSDWCIFRLDCGRAEFRRWRLRYWRRPRLPPQK